MTNRRRPHATDPNVEPNDLLEQVLDDGEDPRRYGFDAREMRIEPRRMRTLLTPEGFVTKTNRRGRGDNRLEYVRTSADFGGLFEILCLHGSLDGEAVEVEFWLSIVPSGHEAPILASAGGSVDPDDLLDVDGPVETSEQARTFESWLCAALPTLRKRLADEEGRVLFDETTPGRELADELIRWLNPGPDPFATHGRLLDTASPEQAELARKLYADCMYGTYGLERFRVLYDIVGLSLVLAEVEGVREFHRFQPGRADASTSPLARIHQAMRILCSRLSQEVGWPRPDPLVPDQTWEEPEVEPVDGGEPLSVEELANQFLEARRHRCHCGSAARYASHLVEDRDDDVVIVVTVTCSSGHESQVELDR